MRWIKKNKHLTLIATELPPMSVMVVKAAIPLLRDVFAAKHLTLEVSGRLADYSIYHIGVVGSYKIGTTWVHRLASSKPSVF